MIIILEVNFNFNFLTSESKLFPVQLYKRDLNLLHKGLE